MNKKILISALLLALAGCGGGGGGGTTTPPATETPPPSNNETPPKTETPPATDNEKPPGGDDNPPPVTVDRLPFPFLAVPAQQLPAGFDPHYDTESLPAIPARNVKHAPIYTDGKISIEAGPTPLQVSKPRVFVGVDQVRSYPGTTGPRFPGTCCQGDIGKLPSTGTRGDTEIRFGQLDDGVSRAAVVGYLQETARGGFEPGKVTRWPQAPTVNIASGTSTRDEQMVLAAVQLVNTALPEEYKLTLGRSEHEISIRFTPDNPRNVGGTARNQSNAAGEMTASEISIYTDTNIYRDSTGNTDLGIPSTRRIVITIAHELLHSLGLNGHVVGLTGSWQNGFASIMGTAGGSYFGTVQNGTEKQPLSILYPVDREALRALYSLDPGDDPEQLGPWASTSTHIHGNSPHAGFGVAMRNGYAEPWAYGYESPATGPNGNAALSGTVTWSGDLVGFTPQSRAVTGDAAISLEIGTLAGTADFTALEQWDAGQAPGEAGSGTQWGDGDLGYRIAVNGNTFRDSGGDSGRLTGVWTGAAHEGVAGTLERTDLTAAFGGSRGE